MNRMRISFLAIVVCVNKSLHAPAYKNKSTSQVKITKLRTINAPLADGAIQIFVLVSFKIVVGGCTDFVQSMYIVGSVKWEHSLCDALFLVYVMQRIQKDPVRRGCVRDPVQ